MRNSAIIPIDGSGSSIFRGSETRYNRCFPEILCHVIVIAASFSSLTFISPASRSWASYSLKSTRSANPQNPHTFREQHFIGSQGGGAEKGARDVNLFSLSPSAPPLFLSFSFYFSSSFLSFCLGCLSL